MNIEEKESLLLKANYDVHDIMLLEECQATKAYGIMNVCRTKYHGIVPGRGNCVKSESYWLYSGTTIDEELRRMRILRGDRNG